MTLSCGHEYENGSGRRKRCPACAKDRHLEQMRTWMKNNYVPKRLIS